MTSSSSLPRSLFVLPPAPNWFSGHALCSAPFGTDDGGGEGGGRGGGSSSPPSGLVAYAAKQEVVLLRDTGEAGRVTREPPTRPRPPPTNDDLVEDGQDGEKDVGKDIPSKSYPSIAIIKAFSDKFKVVAVDLLSEGDSFRLAATSEDGIVRAWSVSAATLEHSENWQEHKVHKDISRDRHRVSSVCWSLTDKGVLISGDEQGNIVVWDTRVNSTRTMSFNKNGILIMKSNPFLRDVVAYGCKLGLVYVVNIAGSGKIIHKIRVSNEDIQGLSWAPAPYNIFEAASGTGGEVGDTEEKEQNCLFAAASRDRTISVWSSKTGKLMASLSLAKLRPDKQNQSWNSCHWVEPSILLINGSFAQLLEWNLKATQLNNEGLYRADEKIEAVQVLHDEHAKILTSITSQHGRVYTIGQDRCVISYDRTSKVLDYKLPAFASWIYCMAANVVDSNLVAVGGGDGQIRIWRTNSSKSLFDMTTIWQRLNSAKITTLAWHPTQEGWLAFGTDEGRVGSVDALNPKSTPNFISYQHRSTVYNLSWGPAATSHEDPDESEGSRKLMLYSCGDGQVVMHNPKGDSQSINVEDIVSMTNGLTRTSPNRSEIAFHPDGGKLVALGSDDGSVELFSMPHLKFVATIKTFQKLIQNLAWHPTYSGSSKCVSKFESWLAVASNENDIHLFDLKEAINSSPEQKSILTTPTVTLSGHTLRVIELCWSPHHEGKLVSVSYDGTGRVWDVSSGTVIANYSGHNGRLVCCLFSPLDPDVVFTGSEDSTLRAWKISEQPKSAPTKKARKPIRKPKEVNKSATSLSDLQTLVDERKEEIASGQLETSQGIKDKKKLREKLLFPLTFKQENARKQEGLDDCLLSKEDVAAMDFDSYIHLGLFLDRAMTEKVLLAEADGLVDNGQTEAACHLHYWHGDVCDTIRTAMKAGQLNDWMINVAAGTSRDLFVEACEAYAIQLEAKEDPIKAASYYLMIHKVDEAIHALSKGNQFRAAVAIAKSRLNPAAPVIKDLYLSWARQATSDGSYEVAAKCWVAGGDPLQAAIVLSKRKDVDALRVAAILTRRSGDEDKAKILATQCVTQCQSGSNPDCLEKLKKEFKDLLSFEEVDIIGTERCNEGQEQALRAQLEEE